MNAIKKKFNDKSEEIHQLSGVKTLKEIFQSRQNATSALESKVSTTKTSPGEPMKINISLNASTPKNFFEKKSMPNTNRNSPNIEKYLNQSMSKKDWQAVKKR